MLNDVDSLTLLLEWLTIVVTAMDEAREEQEMELFELEEAAVLDEARWDEAALTTGVI